MMTDGQDHPIRIQPARNRWRAFFAGHVIADSSDAVVLYEAGYPPVVYFPRDDVSMEYFSRTDRASRCPHKGDAAYYTVMMDGHWAENGAWTYEAPSSGVQTIAGRIAFQSDQIEVYEIDDATVNPHHRTDDMARSEVDDIVQHTDSGGGQSQRDHWAPNVRQPHPDGGLT